MSVFRMHFAYRIQNIEEIEHGYHIVYCLDSLTDWDMCRLEELSFMFEGKDVQDKVQSNIAKQLELGPVGEDKVSGVEISDTKV